MHEEVLEQEHWEEQYEGGGLPWDTGRPSSELKRVVAEYGIRPCRALEIGCGTGASAVWLAEKGFEVTATDLSERALRQARRRAEAADVAVDFVAADVTDPAALSGHFDFVFDCGCYHAVRLADGPGYVRAVERLTRPGALALILTGNAGEPEDSVGPPTLEASELCADWEKAGFDVLHLRAFRFDAPEGAKRYLGWSCLVRRT